MTAQINKLTGNAQKFAMNCYETKSINDLEDDLRVAEYRSSDTIYDCSKWGISANNRRLAIEAALSDKITIENSRP